MELNIDEIKQSSPETKADARPAGALTLAEKRNTLETWIPKLDDLEKRELYEMLQSYHIPHSKNSNGIFINLACLEEEMIDRIYSYCQYYHNARKITGNEEDDAKDETNAFANIDKTLMQECVRDVIKDSLSSHLQEKLNQKLSVFQKESNWKHQPIPNNHTKNAELGKVRGRISRRKNNLLKRCRNISLYLQKNGNTSRDVDCLSGTNDLSVDT